MYFYIDESGHTGTNLFDPAQPTLYYGTLSCASNLDVVAENRLASLRRRLGVPRLHAAELGNGRLALAAGDLHAMQKKLRLRFDLYRVAKADHAVICFFDQIFDHGVNPAITWTGYWTPLRYVLLLKLAFLFDEELAKQAWAARIETRVAQATAGMVAVCEELRSRLNCLPDARSRQLIGDALSWACANPAEIAFNATNRAQVLQVSPNLVGFQSVMHGIAARVRSCGRQASRIIVDQQSQFNGAQKTLAAFYAAAAGERMPLGAGGMPVADYVGMPIIPIEVKAGSESAGLELVDVFLWMFKRLLERKEVAPELMEVIKYQFVRGKTDEVSLAAIAARWSRWYEDLPPLEELPPEALERARTIRRVEEERRQEALRAVNAAGVGEQASSQLDRTT